MKCTMVIITPDTSINDLIRIFDLEFVYLLRDDGRIARVDDADIKFALNSVRRKDGILVYFTKNADANGVVLSSENEVTAP